MANESARDLRNSVLIFAIKTVVFLLILAIAIDFFLPSFDVNRVFSERNKLYMLGIVQNPAALYQTSELAEKAGFLESARRDMELAVGLVELHARDQKTAQRYYDRLEALKRKTDGARKHQTAK